MSKIRKNIFLVLDTETADLSGSVYDIGYVICDKAGTIIAEYNALVEEVFTDATKMMGAFYAKKLFSHYAPMLDGGDIHLVPWANIIAQLNEDIETFGVTCICAYNAGFDFRVMSQTNQMLGYTGRVLQAPLQTLDIWRFACETKLKQKAYRRVALENGWTSKAGNLKTGAEFAYRFCSGDFGFVEEHTALSDAIIESAILAECFRQRRKVPYGKIGGAPWKLVQEEKAA